MSKLRVAILCGGASPEHEVSLQSASNILQFIDRDKYEVILIVIDKAGKWYLANEADYLLDADDPRKIRLKPQQQELALVPGKGKQQIYNLSTQAFLPGLDIIFPVMHGTGAEDGVLQGIMKALNVAFVGAGIAGSAICIDKDLTKRLLKQAGLNITPFMCMQRHEKDSFSYEQIVQNLGSPFFVKAACQGSSIGVMMVNNQAEYEEAINCAFSYDHKILLEKNVDGREIECAVLGNDTPKASLCGELVRVQDKFYSYDAKYLSSESYRVKIPAELPTSIHKELQEQAVLAFKVLECVGLARVDFFVTNDNEIIVNEVNTLPGFTNISMYPKLWEATSINYADLIDKLLELAMDKAQQDALLTGKL